MGRALYGPAADRLSPREILNLVAHLPDDSATAGDLLGPRAAWRVDTVLLARIASLLEAANWQRAAGRGPRPRPVRVPEPRPRRNRGGVDTARRLRNLGLLPGQPTPPPGEDLDPLERIIAAQLAAAARRGG